MSFLTGLFLPIEVPTTWSAQRCRGLRFAQGPQAKHRHGSPKILPALVHGQPSAPGCVLCQAGCQQARLLPDSPSSFCSIVSFIFISNPVTFRCPAFSSSPRPFILSGSVFPQSQNGTGQCQRGGMDTATVLGWGCSLSGTPVAPARTVPFRFLARCFQDPGRERGQVLPCCCEAFFGQEACWSRVCYSKPSFSLCGEHRTFRALSDASQGGGQLIPNGHTIPPCWCSVMPRGLAAEPGAAAQAWPGGRPWQGLWAGSGAAVGKHNPLSISSAQIVSLLAPCASKSVVCLSLEDTLPSASK